MSHLVSLVVARFYIKHVYFILFFLIQTPLTSKMSTHKRKQTTESTLKPTKKMKTKMTEEEVWKLKNFSFSMKKKFDKQMSHFECSTINFWLRKKMVDWNESANGLEWQSESNINVLIQLVLENGHRRQNNVLTMIIIVRRAFYTIETMSIDSISSD